MASAPSFDEARERLARLSEARRPTLLPKHELFEAEADDAPASVGPLFSPSGWPFPLTASQRGVDDDEHDFEEHSSVRLSRGRVVDDGGEQDEQDDRRNQKRPA